MSLVSYSSSDEEKEDENPKRLKSSSEKNDRIRSFPHEVGNWALSIYSFVACSSYLEALIDDLMELFDENCWKRLTELHISLSKTFPIRFHHIESIRQGIQHEFSLENVTFIARVENVTILTNDDRSTSFLVLTLDQHREFSKLIEMIDKVLREHRYPGYYENPCFHISFAYSTDPKFAKDWQDKAESILRQYQCQPSALSIPMDDIRLKAGKRVYHLTKSC